MLTRVGETMGSRPDLSGDLRSPGGPRLFSGLQEVVEGGIGFDFSRNPSPSRPSARARHSRCWSARARSSSFGICVRAVGFDFCSHGRPRRPRAWDGRTASSSWISESFDPSRLRGHGSSADQPRLGPRGRDFTLKAKERT